MSLAGYLHSMFVLGVSMFYVMRLLQSFIGSGNYSIVGPYLFRPSDGAFTQPRRANEFATMSRSRGKCRCRRIPLR